MIRLILLVFLGYATSVSAQGEPLNVGIESFDPPLSCKVPKMMLTALMWI